MPDSGAHIERILVALDHSDDSRTTLAEAAVLAAQLQAELVGLFIEDVKLIEAAQLPFVRQISLTGQSAPFDRVAMERSFRAQEQAARQLLESVALRHRLSWSFRVARGRASVEILAQVQGVDLVIVGKTAPTVTRQGRIGATALAVADALHGAILFSEPRAAHVLGHGGPVLAVFDGGAAADRALAIAARLAGAGGQILVVVSPGDAAERQALRQRAGERLAALGATARFIGVTDHGPAALEDALLQAGGGLIVIGEHAPMLGGLPLADLLALLRAPMLVVAAA